MITPSEALDLKRRLLQWLETGDAYEFYLSMYTSNENFSILLDGAAYGEDEHPVSLYITGVHHHVLLSDQTYIVSDDMFDVAVAAGKSMPPQVLLRSDPPSLTGFIFFPSDFAPGVHSDKGISTVALSWACDDSAVWIIAYATVDGTNWIRPAQAGCWPFDDAEAHSHNNRMFGGETLLAAWTIMQQPFVTIRQELASRASVKRSRRARMSHTDISVIRLRRMVAKPSGEQGSREYRHRWIVNGHWRNQYLPSRKTHRLQWIPAYLKGPEGAPLKVTEKVYSWER
jgi:hypothetical protein